MKKKTLVEGPFGLRLTEDVARDVERRLPTLPKDCRRLIRKSAVAESTELVKGERADVSMISVENVDTDNEVVIALGLDLEPFRQNPVVSWSHRVTELPIGHAQWIKHVPGGVRAKTSYTDAHETARAVWAMVSDGTLKGKSVGMIATSIRSATEDEVAKNKAWADAAILETGLLLEYSVVSVPANRLALVEAVAKGHTDAQTLRLLGLDLPAPPKRKAKAKAGADADEAYLAEFLAALQNIQIDEERIWQLVTDRYKV